MIEAGLSAQSMRGRRLRRPQRGSNTIIRTMTQAPIAIHLNAEKN
jgi:hypothetical protein